MTKKVIINDTSTLHFVLVPLMAQGHMIPMVDLARLLAERGVLVTLITTPFNAARIQTTINRAKESGLPIRFVPLRFPCEEVGLPEGCENVDVLPWDVDSGKKFFKATTLLGPPLEAYLRSQQRPHPSCIISDSCHPWTLEVARSLRVPRLTFFSICSFTLLCEFNIIQHRIYDAITHVSEPFLVPGLTHRIEVTKAKAPGFFTGPDWEQIGEDVRAADRASDGVVVNSFYEMEPWYLDSYRKAMGQNVWALGPLSLSNKKLTDMAARGKDASIDKDRCLRWLDSMEPRSVVYVSFGSVTYTPPSQLIEIGLGLEASGSPFIWVIKEAEWSPEVEGWLMSTEGFEERTRSRSLIVKGWAPQVMILSHPAVGGFMTHCGWNSSFEAVSAGVPMITWPFLADQFLNEEMIVEVLQIGVRVGVESPSGWGVITDDWAPVKREEVEKAVRRLMEEGEEGEERRERARELGKKARKAMEEQGSSHENMTLFIHSFSQQANNGHVEKEL